MMTLLAIIVSVLMLVPFVLYLVGRIRDPFHPLIFVGVLSYFLIPNRLLFNRASTLEIVDEHFFNPFLVASILSMLGIYLGWYLGGRRRIVDSQIEQDAYQYDPGRMALCAVVCGIVADISHYLYKDIGYTVEVSGYARDLSRLWIAAAILLVQAIFLTPRGSRMPFYLLLPVVLYPPLERFLNYGQRGDTFRMAMLFMLAYMMVGKRPSKAVYLSAVAALSIVLATLALTRSVVLNGDAANRLDALVQVIPQYFQGKLTHADPADEEIFGAAIVNTLRSSGEYGKGLSITVGIVGRFLPRQLFPQKDQYVTFSGGYDMDRLHAETGLRIPYGSSPSGFANGFAELSWGCPIIWMVAGYVYRRFWEKATAHGSVRNLGYLLGYTMAIFYAISQELITGEVNMVYVLLPLLLVYTVARVPRTRAATPEFS